METPAIFTSMVKALETIGMIGISKDQKNQAQGFKFRGIDQVYNALNPILAENKIFTTSEVLEDDSDEHTNHKGTVLFYRRVRMRYTFWSGIDGSSVSTEVIGEGMDSGDKATNKAMAIAHKYALLQAFCIPTEETDDPDKDSHTVTKKQMVQPPQQNDSILYTKIMEIAKDNFSKGKNKYYKKILTDKLQKIKTKDLTIDDLHHVVRMLEEYQGTSIEYFEERASIIEEIKKIHEENIHNKKYQYYDNATIKNVNNLEVIETVSQAKAILNKLNFYKDNPPEFFAEHIDEINEARQELPF